MTDSYPFYVIAAAFVALLLLERRFPLRMPKSRFAERFIVNAIVSSLAIAVAIIVVKPVATAVFERVTENHWGLAPIMSSNVMIQGALAFLLMDLSFYYWHRANHLWPLLWRFHNAHHIDPDLDVSTAYRFHFVEIGFSAGFRVIQIVLIGGQPWVFIAYEFVFQLNTLFQHSNVCLPIAVERWLSLILVTPRMHGIHHSQIREENNSNWSSVFSCWDRLHGSLCLNIPQAQVRIGIPGYSLAEDNRVINILVMPFRKQRDYWRGPSGRSAGRPSRPGGSSASRMAQ